MTHVLHSWLNRRIDLVDALGITDQLNVLHGRGQVFAFARQRPRLRPQKLQ